MGEIYEHIEFGGKDKKAQKRKKYDTGAVGGTARRLASDGIEVGGKYFLPGNGKDTAAL